MGPIRWKLTLPVTNIKGLDLILGRDFLKKFNPEINWVTRTASIYKQDRRVPLPNWSNTGDIPEETLARFEKDVKQTMAGFVGAASAPSGRRRNTKGKGSKGGGGGSGGSNGGGEGGGKGGGGGGGGTGGGTGSGGISGGGGGRGGGGGGGGGSSCGGGRGGGDGAGRGAAAQRGGFGGSQRQQQLRNRETPSVQQLREWYAGRGRPGSTGPCTYVLRTGTRIGEFLDAVELPRWHDQLLQNVPIFDLDFDAILAAMYALADSAEGDCYAHTTHATHEHMMGGRQT
ncbi:unnamed protein product [Closterium sp. NIES-54]